MNRLTSKETEMGDDRDSYYSIYHRKDKLMLRVVLVLKLGESRDSELYTVGVWLIHRIVE